MQNSVIGSIAWVWFKIFGFTRRNWAAGVNRFAFQENLPMLSFTDHSKFLFFTTTKLIRLFLIFCRGCFGQGAGSNRGNGSAICGESQWRWAPLWSTQTWARFCCEPDGGWDLQTQSESSTWKYFQWILCILYAYFTIYNICETFN